MPKTYRTNEQNIELLRKPSHTAKELCEAIHDFLLDVNGEDIDPQAIFKASPSGELFHLQELYIIARQHFTNDVYQIENNGNITWTKKP
jgi:hypothetical protein